jgi:hypothetical protein
MTNGGRRGEPVTRSLLIAEETTLTAPHRGKKNRKNQRAFSHTC